MTITQTVFALTCVVSVGVGGLQFRASVGRPIWDRLGVAVLPFLGCTVLWHWVVSIAFSSMAGFWNGARLAPAMGLIYGYGLYYPATEGPISGWIYGPVSALAFLPAVLLGNSGVQILVARCLSLFYYYAPAAWLLLRQDEEGRRGRPDVGSLLLFSAFVLLTTNSHALRYSAIEVHADAPALSLAAWAVVVMVRGGGGQNPWTCALSLMLAVLAVWAKQLTIPLLTIVLPAYALATGALKRPFWFFLPGFVGGLAITLVLLAVFDPGNLFFNVVQAPSRHPLRAKVGVDFLYPLVVLQEKHASLLFLLAVGGVGRLAAAFDNLGSPDAPERLRLSDGDWIVFLLTGLAELPFSVLGYFGVGGNDNSLSFSLYFLSLGTLLMLKPLLGPASRLGSVSESKRKPTPWVWYLLIGLNLMLATVENEVLGIALVQRKGAWQDSLLAERFIVAHRGEVYFPWHPQSHLVVEGKLYHAEDGLYDRALSGYPPTADHFFRHIPPRTRLVCYPPNAMGVTRSGAMTYLKGFRQTSVSDLPGWSCFERP